jgi:hypothetical protein
MGLCKAHAIMAEVSFWEIGILKEINISALGIDAREEKKVPKLLCDICFKTVAAEQAKKTDADLIKEGN